MISIKINKEKSLSDKRFEIFEEIIKKINKRKIRIGGLYNCGELGFVYIYFDRFVWSCRWWDQEDVINNIDDFLSS